jgi:hypothetical protein
LSKSCKAHKRSQPVYGDVPGCNSRNDKSLSAKKKKDLERAVAALNDALDTTLTEFFFIACRLRPSPLSVVSSCRDKLTFSTTCLQSDTRHLMNTELCCQNTYNSSTIGNGWTRLGRVNRNLVLGVCPHRGHGDLGSPVATAAQLARTIEAPCLAASPRRPFGVSEGWRRTGLV